MSTHAFRVLAPRTNYDELNIVLRFTLKPRKKLSRAVCYQQCTTRCDFLLFTQSNLTERLNIFRVEVHPLQPIESFS